VNYLAKVINKFPKGFINVEIQKLEYEERMMTLFIKLNEKLAIKYMEFELQSQKLELESCAQAQTIQLAIAKILSDILDAYKWFKNL